MVPHLQLDAAGNRLFTYYLLLMAIETSESVFMVNGMRGYGPQNTANEYYPCRHICSALDMRHVASGQYASMQGNAECGFWYGGRD